MKRKLQERGQALILIAFGAVALFGFAALAVDGTRVFSDRRHAQNAADASALAAALGSIRADPPETADSVAEAAGLERAASNGFDNSTSIVEVHNCSEANLDPPCTGLPADADPSEYIQVVIRLSTPTTFARVLGWNEVGSIVSAIARADYGGKEPIGQGAALSAMSLNERNAVKLHGNGRIDILNSGIFDNSMDGCAFGALGNGTYTVDTAFEVVGGSCPSGFPTLAGGPVQLGASQLPYPPLINIPEPSITCTGDSVYVPEDRLYTPGNHTNLDIPNGTVTFAPGNHCFDGGVNISGNTNVIAYNANFLIRSGEFRLNNNGAFICNNLLVHIDGGSGFKVNGNSDNRCEGVTFYASTGDVGWQGNPEIDFSAPAFGTYKGLLIYLPYGNNAPLTFNGNSDIRLSGSIIAVSSHIKVTGNTTAFAFNTEIVGHTVDVGGNVDITIDYNPGDVYLQTLPTDIEMTE